MSYTPPKQCLTSLDTGQTGFLPSNTHEDAFLYMLQDLQVLVGEYENHVGSIWDIYYLLWPIRLQHLCQSVSKHRY